MALPSSGYLGDSSRTTSEFQVGLDALVEQVAKGFSDYVSSRTYLYGSKVNATNNVVYTSKSAANTGNTPQSDDGSNWYASVYDNLIGDWEDLTGQAYKGQGVFLYGALYRVKTDISSIESERPTSTNDNYSVVSYNPVYLYAVSQLAGGETSKVSFIYSGLSVTPIDYLIYPDDGRIYSASGITGTTSGDFNPETGVDSGLSGAVTEFGLSNINDEIDALSQSIEELLSDDSISTDMIQDFSVTSDKIADDAITTDKLADGAIGADQIGDGVITNDNIAALTIQNGRLADGIIDTDKLADDAVTSDKLEANAVRLQYATTSYNEVGSVAFLRSTSSSNINQGNTVSGSSLVYSNANGTDDGDTASGTWRCLGNIQDNTTSNAERVSLFIRIS